MKRSFRPPFLKRGSTLGFRGAAFFVPRGFAVAAAALFFVTGRLIVVFFIPLFDDFFFATTRFAMIASCFSIMSAKRLPDSRCRDENARAQFSGEPESPRVLVESRRQGRIGRNPRFTQLARGTLYLAVDRWYSLFRDATHGDREIVGGTLSYHRRSSLHPANVGWTGRSGDPKGLGAA